MRRATWLLAACLLIVGCSSSKSTPASGSDTVDNGAATSSTPRIPASNEPVTLDGVSAWVAGAQPGDREVIADVGDCQPFFDAIADGPFNEQTCGVWNAVGGQRMWTLTNGTTNGFLAIIWQQVAGNRWSPRLRAQQPGDSDWANFDIRTANIDSGPNDELVSALSAGGSYNLSVEVVDIRDDSPIVMFATSGLVNGRVILLPQVGVELWNGVYDDGAFEGDAPVAFQEFLVAAARGQWSLTPGPMLTNGEAGIPSFTDELIGIGEQPLGDSSGEDGSGDGPGDDGSSGQGDGTVDPVESAWVIGASSGEPVVSSTGDDCQPFYDALADGPYTEQRCGTWNALGGARTWTITRGASGRLVAIIWQLTASGTWAPQARAAEATPGQWSAFNIKTGNLDGDPEEELASGLRVGGTPYTLDVAVLEVVADVPQVVAAVNSSVNGIADFVDNYEVMIFSFIYGDGDPECCPTHWVVYAITRQSGTWKVIEAGSGSNLNWTFPENDF